MNAKSDRRLVMAVIGAGSRLEPNVEQLCCALGQQAIDAGFRIVTGGLGGVMAAVSKGARTAARRREGDIVGVLPMYDAELANPYVDIVIPTGMGIARNVMVVASGDVVVAIGGGSGTLSEIALAWQLGKPLIALSPAGGWAQKLAGQRVDGRRDDPIFEAQTAEQAIEQALAAVTHLSSRP